MYSIYHFFAHLIRNKQLFAELEQLDSFPFDVELLSCRNEGIFPDLAIKINRDPTHYSGGELIELKDSKKYAVSSFNSTIPSGQKDITKLLGTGQSIIRQQMESAGDDILSLPMREVFYLLRGRRKANVKVCLVHGSFFETVKVEDLIRESFSQVFDEAIENSEIDLDEDFKQKLLAIFSNQESFSKVRNVDNATVKLRFRIMTETKAEGNIFDKRKYPQIMDNTLNFVVPLHGDELEADKYEEIVYNQMQTATSHEEFRQLEIFTIKHPFNGDFLVFQTAI